METSEIDIDISVSIPEFYKEKTVFLTGFTGTIGKVIAEKLLYSCPDVKRIYVLIRAKRGKTPQERANEALKSLAFTRLREQRGGEWEQKVVAVSGDMMDDKMGLSEEDEDLLRREVDIIIHGAASVRFDDPLQIAIKQNTLGAKKMVDLALTMPHLKSFVYISTAYTNCDHLYIKEELYPPKGDWRETIKYSMKLDPAVVQTVHRKIINGLPNTYAFSKNLSEHVINDYRDRLPVVIVRPSVVIPSFKEPLVGWTDNKYGPVAYLLGFLFGVLRCSWVSLQEKCNYMHSDVCVNATLIASWKTAFTYNSKNKSAAVTIYNVCEPPENSLNHKELSQIYEGTGAKEDLDRDRLFYVSVMFFENELWYRINILVRHVLPAFLIDRLLVLLNKPPMLLFARMKIFIATSALRFFTERTFHFETTKFTKMVDSLKPEDRDVFGFGWDFKKDRFKSIFYQGFILMKRVILKPLYDDIKEMPKRLILLFIIDRSVVYFVYGSLLWSLYAFSIPQKLISLTISFFILP